MHQLVLAYNPVQLNAGVEFNHLSIQCKITNKQNLFTHNCVKPKTQSK